MATYKVLKPMLVRQEYLEPGRIISDDPNGEIPVGWEPPSLAWLSP